MAEILCGLILGYIALCVAGWLLRGFVDFARACLPDEKREREILSRKHALAVADATHDWVANWDSHSAEENEDWAWRKGLNGRGRI